jgi:hypothetical protein
MKILMAIMTDYTVFYGIYDNTGERFFLMIPPPPQILGFAHQVHLLPAAPPFHIQVRADPNDK